MIDVFIFVNFFFFFWFKNVANTMIMYFSSIFVEQALKVYLTFLTRRRKSYLFRSSAVE